MNVNPIKKVVNNLSKVEVQLSLSLKGRKHTIVKWLLTPFQGWKQGFISSSGVARCYCFYPFRVKMQELLKNHFFSPES